MKIRMKMKVRIIMKIGMKMKVRIVMKISMKVDDDDSDSMGNTVDKAVAQKIMNGKDKRDGDN